MSGPERRYLPLFVAVLLNNHVFDFKDIGTNVLGLWALSVSKPWRYLAYENYLAEVLKKHNFDFMEGATIAAGIAPDYNSNVDMLSCVMHHMRKKLREAESAQMCRQLRGEYEKSLQVVMQRMKEDLALLRPEPAEHKAYIGFIRQAISLIKSHGVNICAVDPFFTQPGPDFSPSEQDPQLHTAGIVAYGVKMGENDARAVPQLFHYLYNNFKMALINGKLEQERRILERAMRSDAHIVSFMLEHMVPAVVSACAQASEAWLLLEVYAGALGDVLTAALIPKELVGTAVQHAAKVLRSVLAWFASLGEWEGGGLGLQQVYCMRLLARLADALQPSLRTYLYAGHDGDEASVERTVQRMERFLEGARDHVGEVLDLPDEDFTLERIRVEALLGGLQPDGTSASKDHRVQEFVRTIVTDIRKSWEVSAERVTVQVAAAGRIGMPSATQAGQGTQYGPWDGRELLRGWHALTARWGQLGGTAEKSGRSGARRRRRGRSDIHDDMFL